jgi:hypothetical protein
MSKRSSVIIVSVAILAGLSGIAQADNSQHRGQAVKAVRPISEATLRKLQDQNIYGMAVARPDLVVATPRPQCSDMTCPGFALIGIGF